MRSFASLIGFSTSTHNKTNYIQKIGKKIFTFIFYQRAVVKQNHYMTQLLSYASTFICCSLSKIQRYLAALKIQLRFLCIRKEYVSDCATIHSKFDCFSPFFIYVLSKLLKSEQYFQQYM
jgi:hypothetical protein